MKFWQKTIAVVATFALLLNSLVAPLSVLAQDATPQTTTNPATDITLTDATLNGKIGGSDAVGHSFWVSLDTFDTSSPTIPANVYSTPILGPVAANADFSASLASITTTGVPTNLPAVTPNTTYYFAAWSEVGGTWYPGAIQTFTTISAPVFNGNIEGFVGAAGLTVSGNTTGDFVTTISGNLTGGVDGQWATFSGTVSGDINGGMTGKINWNGYDTLFAEITGSGASGHVYLIAGFSGPIGNFQGKIITQDNPISLITSITITGDSSVQLGNTAQMSATTDGTSHEIAWTVWTGTDSSYGSATINKDTGLLTATGIGKVIVIASALDGSLVTKDYEVTIQDTTPPTVPVLISPINGVFTNNNALLMQWDDSTDTGGSGVVGYEYQVHYNCSDSSNIPGSCSSSYTHPSLIINSELQGGTTPDGTYYWQVRAKDNAGNFSNWSGFEEVVIDTAAPTVPGIPTTTPNPTNSLSQSWLWNTSTDTLGSGVNGYYQNIYNVLTLDSSDWSWIGNVLGISTNLTDGQWQLQLKTKDNAGNVSEVVSSTTLTVDSVLPSIPSDLKFVNPNLVCGATTNIKTVTIDWSDSTDNVGITGYDYYIDYPLGAGRGVWNTFFTNSQNRGTLNEGTHYIKVRAKDTAGNVSSWTDLCSVTYDSIVPTGTITYSTTTLTNGDVVATLVPSETVTVTNNGGSTSYTFTTNGTFTFEFEDIAGNIGSATATVSNIDKTPPGIPTLVTPVNDAIVNGNPTQSWNSATDTHHYIYASYSDYEGNHGIYTTNVNGTRRTVGGTQTIVFYWRVKAVDAVGNEGDWSEMRKLTIDNIAPVISNISNIELVNDTGMSGAIAYYTPIANDGIDGVVPVTCDPVSGSFFPVGTTDVSCSASDTAGNTTTATFTITVRDSEAPTINSLSSSSHTLGEWSNDRNIDVSWTADDNGGGSGVAGYSYTWDQNATSDPDELINTTSTSNTSTNFATSQSIYFHIRAVDNIGNWSTTSHIGPFWIDSVNPTVEWRDLMDGSLLRGTVQLEVSASDNVGGSGIDFVRFRYEPVGGSFRNITEISTEPYQTSWNTNTPSIADGNYILRARAFDVSGKSSPLAQSDIQVTIDNTAPTITFASIYSNNSNSDYAKVGDTVTLTFAFSEEVTEPTVTIAGHSITPILIEGNSWEASYTMTSDDSEGVIPFTIDYSDPAGNTGTQASSTTNESYVIFDKTETSISVEYSIRDWTNGNVLATASADESGDFTNIGGSTHEFTENGNFTFTFIDLAGNESSVVASVDNIDKVNPYGDWINPLNGSTVSGIITLNFNGRDDLSDVGSIVYQYKAEGETIFRTDENISGNTWDTRGLPLGNYVLKATVTDNAGNIYISEITVGVSAIVSSQSAVSTSYSEAVITWTTDKPSTSRVVYDTVSHDLGIEPNYGYTFSTTEDSSKVTSHSVTLTGLTAGQTYYYRVISHGSPVVVGGEGTFNVLSVAGAPAPSGNAGGAVLGITAPLTSWPKLAYVNTGSGNEESNVLGAETDATATQGSSVSSTTLNQKVGVIKWILTHKKISLGSFLLLILLIYLLTKKKNNK